jgi:GINS complex subunit 1
VRMVCEETGALYRQIKHVAGAAAAPGAELPKEVGCTLTVYNASAYRNKRCLMAYHKHRMNKLVDLRWQSGSALPEHAQRKLSEDEQQYYRDYDALLCAYARDVDVDLLAVQEPPKDQYIEVRVLESAGELTTESGATLSLDKNTTHFLRRCDVEHLIRQGLLEQIA